MSLKLPGIGKIIKEYDYCVELSHQEDIIVCVMFDKPLKNKVTERQHRLYVIKPDQTWPDRIIIVEVIKELLQKGLGRKQVRIREDVPRLYLHINFDRFSGRRII